MVSRNKYKCSYLPDQIKSFIKKKKFKVKITISNEENLLLDTGGGCS